ncbi:MAG: TIGR00730 family Rossman fold protein [Pararhodobacter sp.]|nr:TIGR00730 family Rossman fold protein [Pararhodobacter sp.]
MSFTASVCLFCGARSGADPMLAEMARETGQHFARNGWRLVYGAGDIGLMGEVAHAAQEAGGHTMGVIPQHLMQRERQRNSGAGNGRATLVVTETMHERKKVMFTNSDAAIVLPGGAGTLDEFFEVLTWAQIGLHAKPIMLLDAGGFWQPLRALIDHVIAQGFAEPSLRDLFTAAADVPALAKALERHLPAPGTR